MRTSTLAIWAVAFGVAVISTLILMTGSQPRQPTLWSEIFILLPYLFAIMVSGNPHGPSEAAAWVALVVELTLILGALLLALRAVVKALAPPRL